MEKSLFSFIWKYSRRDQIMLLAVTIVTFPFLYASLELPKRIINDAIGATSSMVTVFGFDLPQVQFLFLLCFAYLASVTAHGLMKMRLNTMKGVVAERMLRRFRYTLLSRMLRFPKRYFRTTSQGELVSMVTSEAEPMGGLMGDALAQPVFQAGQMLIILIFLFLQSFWFGLAGIALIPLQAWLIPMLQRQINLLNKDRINEIRAFSSEIGETAAGISDLRTNGGIRYRLARFSARLGLLFTIRFRIYQKKFFMKFLNNFITQLTPFFFYAVGGYLAIRGDITVGALVAALAAYKDLSSPWKELLTYYNQTQDMSLRWQIVTEKFAPDGMIDAALFDGEPAEVPHLKGEIVLDKVTVRNADGTPVLEDINLRIPQGARVAIQSTSQAERTAFAELLAREVIPSRGTVHIADHDIATLHQAVIAARIGYAHSKPYMFDGTLGDNLLMPLMPGPREVPLKLDTLAMEAKRSGNSTDLTSVDWVDPTIAGLDDPDQIRAWWFELVGAMELDDSMFRRMLNAKIDPDLHPELATAIVALRDDAQQLIRDEALEDTVFFLDPDHFNPTVPLGANLMFAAPRRMISLEGLAADSSFLGAITEHGITEQAIGISQTVIEELHQTFGRDGTEHPLFQALGISDTLYERLVDIALRRREKGDESLDEEEFAQLLIVPFLFTAEQIGPAFPESFKREIVDIRQRHGAAIRETISDLFVPIDRDTYLPRSTILENVLYGRIGRQAGNRAEDIEALVAKMVIDHGLRRQVAETVFDLPVGLGGGNFTGVFHERAAFARAAIKRPDVLILDRALASHDAEARRRTRFALGRLLPDTTICFLEESFQTPEAYDLFVEIKNGRIDGVQRAGEDDEMGSADLRRKLRVIGSTQLFGQLDARNQRLLAFSADWYKAKPGQRIFAMHDKPDAAYLCVKGEAELKYDSDSGEENVVSIVKPGRVIGDLAIIQNEPRQLHLDALSEVVFLRIDAKDYRAVIENDRSVLLSLLRTVSGHLSEVAVKLREASGPQRDGDSPT